jgi:ATP-dependent helicase/nuclease subunit B
LGWVLRPAEAPAPRQDGTARIFRAVGEVNEVREVLRSCAGQGLPFDEVEILHTDAATYLPLIYEIVFRLMDDEPGEALPVTFAEGIPARYGRPARALLGWLSWIREGYPQSTLIRMIQDGLLRIDGTDGDEIPFTKLGALLRTVPIGSGRARYLTKIDQAIGTVERQRASGRLNNGEGEGASSEEPRLGRRLQGLHTIRYLVQDLLTNTPERVARQKDLLKAAQGFLDRHTRHTNRFDEYVRKKLSDEIRGLAECIETEDAEGFDIWKWLEDKCLASPVRGERPQPGRFHVAPVQRGGHSGRKYTFIIGLDDTRFPGAGLQDPLLLDGERRRVSEDLPTSAGRLARTNLGFARLLARLRGKVTMSYCCRSLEDDREMFPSPMVLAAFRILTGNPEGDQDDLIRWLPQPASFAPGRLDRCIDLTESWQWWMCEGDGILDPQEVIVLNFPHLGRGFVAKQARASNRFTEYDGHVPQAGLDLDPTKPDGPVLSASALEMVGSCPMEYFFRYVLGIRPPDEVRIDPRVWLDPAERGQLLHAVFRRFMQRLSEQDLLPDFQRDEKLLMETLDQELTWWQDSKPAPSRATYERETLDLRQASRIFLQEEEVFCRGSRPFCFEASVGMLPEGQGTPLDTLQPVSLNLGGRATLRARGRIDRVDQVPGAGGKQYTVWDYKTGSSWRYRRERAGAAEDPFLQGRLVQGALYLQLAESRLKETVSPEAAVDRFGYFFPTPGEHGERVEWTAAELAQGLRVLGRLCELLARGAFPFTDDPGDVNYSDYKDAFGDVYAVARTCSRKLENRENKALEPFRRLRGYDQK